MDFRRNISVSGGLPSAEYHQPAEQVLSPSCCKLGNSLDDLFPTHSSEGDVSLEWLSVFVEDCLSGTGNSLTPSVPVPMPLPTNTTPNPSKPMPLGKLTKQNTYTFPLNKFTVPGKVRSKRRRCPATKVKASITSWSSPVNPNYQTLQFTCSDPPLLQQAYWLADSELILPKKESTTNTNTVTSTKDIRNCKSDEQVVVETEEIEMMKGKASLSGIETSNGIIEGGFGGQNQQQLQQQQPRRCSHCMAQRTPQWRAGPMGPKTLCNACGVRYKSGRLLPEYRPAKSPTFVSYKHSNSHKKVLEMRMALLSSNT